jgi:Kiwa KwaB-like protein
MIERHIRGANVAEPYASETTDQDDRVFVHPVSGTDFPVLAAEIMRGLDAPKVQSIEEFKNAAGTIISVDIGRQNTLFAFRRRPEAWNLKKLNGWVNAIFRNEKLVDIDSAVVLRLDQRVDYFGFGDQLFILNKRNFEYALNFRAGMEKTRDRVINEFQSRSLFTDVEPLKQKAASNLHYLRKLTTVEKSAYYKDPQFMDALKTVSERENWGLEFVQGKLVMTADNLDLIITLLCNNRVQSMVNRERFDVEGVKKPIGT